MVQKKPAGDNGDISANGIVLNTDTDKPLNRVVGHEVTHKLSTAKHYTQLRDAVFAYARAKGVDIDGKLADRGKLYEGIADANPEAELVADLVGDYLFTDYEFVSNLSVEHQNVFQRLWNEIKYLCKIATAGSQEGRDLARVEKVFADAYRKGGQTQKNTAEDGGTRYSLNQFEDGRRFVDVTVDQRQFDGLSIVEMNSLAKQIIKNKYAGKVIGIDNKAFVNGNSAEKYVYYPHGTDESIVEAKARASTELDNLIDAGTNFRTAEDGADGHIHPDAVGGFSYFDTVFKVGDQYYLGTINIKNNRKGKLFYGVTKVENITQDIHGSYGETPMTIFLRDVSMERVAQKNNSVKTENSLSQKGEQYTPIGDFDVYGRDIEQTRVDAVMADVTEQAQQQKNQTASQQEQVDAIMADAMGKAHVNPSNPAMGAGVGDMGAKTSDFRHEVKESQTATNTIGKNEEHWGVPEDARTETAYDAVTEEESLHNARLRLLQDAQGEIDALKRAAAWTNEEVDMGMLLLASYRREAKVSGDHLFVNEDPAHFISRLKSLKKAVPTNDHAGSSEDSKS